MHTETATATRPEFAAFYRATESVRLAEAAIVFAPNGADLIRLHRSLDADHARLAEATKALAAIDGGIAAYCEWFAAAKAQVPGRDA